MQRWKKTLKKKKIEVRLNAGSGILSTWRSLKKKYYIEREEAYKKEDPKLEPKFKCKPQG